MTTHCGGFSRYTYLVILMSATLVLYGCKKKHSRSHDSSAEPLAGVTVDEGLDPVACLGDPAFADSKGLAVALSALEKRVQFATEKPTQPMLDAIKLGFSAIPPDFQVAFLELGGAIIVSSDSNGLCTARERIAAAEDSKKFSVADLAAMKEGFDDVSSCHLFMPPSEFEKKHKQKGQLLMIVLPDDDVEIKHSFVRAFGYVVSQLLSRLVFLPDSNQVTWVSRENATFHEKKAKIAESFLKDVSASADAVNFITSAQASAEGKRNLADFVYAEAFGSYYCNAYDSGAKNTREAMRRDFPHTFNALIGVDSAPEQKLAESPESRQEVAPDEAVAALKNALLVGRSRTFDNAPQLIGETMNRYNWYMLADDLAGEMAPGSTGPLGLWWNPLAGVNETFQGAGILYAEYYNGTEEATLAAFDALFTSGQRPGALDAVSAAVSGVSEGTGYTAVYNNIEDKTDTIYTQVQNGLGTDKPLGILDTTSVVLNATADQVRDVPGPVGSFIGAAQDGVTTIDGGKFDESGQFQEAAFGDRLNAVVGLSTAVLGESGAMEALTDSVMSSGGMIKHFGHRNPDLSDLGQDVVSKAGETLQHLNIVEHQLGEALKAQSSLGQAFQALNGINSFVNGPAPTDVADWTTSGVIKITDMIAADSDGPAASPTLPKPEKEDEKEPGKQDEEEDDDAPDEKPDVDEPDDDDSEDEDDDVPLEPGCDRFLAISSPSGSAEVVIAEPAVAGSLDGQGRIRLRVVERGHGDPSAPCLSPTPVLSELFTAQVSYEITPAATSGATPDADFTLASGSVGGTVTLAPGAASVELVISGVQDGMTEPAESFTLRLTSFQANLPASIDPSADTVTGIVVDSCGSPSETTDRMQQLGAAVPQYGDRMRLVLPAGVDLVSVEEMWELETIASNDVNHIEPYVGMTPDRHDGNDGWSVNSVGYMVFNHHTNPDFFSGGFEYVYYSGDNVLIDLDGTSSGTFSGPQDKVRWTQFLKIRPEGEVEAGFKCFDSPIWGRHDAVRAGRVAFAKGNLNDYANSFSIPFRINEIGVMRIVGMTYTLSDGSLIHDSATYEVLRNDQWFAYRMGTASLLPRPYYYSIHAGGGLD